MAKDFTPHQQKIISRYYDNRDQLDEQRLSELVTSLYLATSAKQIEKKWATAEEMMHRLGVPAGRIEHILERKDAALLAAVVQDLQAGKIKKPAPAPKTAPTADAAPVPSKPKAPRRRKD